MSDESGQDEVDLKAYPGPGPKMSASVDGGYEPVWSLGGDELFYRSGTRIMTVEVQAEPFGLSPPRRRVCSLRPETPSWTISGDRHTMFLPPMGDS